MWQLLACSFPLAMRFRRRLAATVLTTAAPFFTAADTNTTEACPPTCLLKTCEAWVKEHVNTCSGLEDVGCDVRALLSLHLPVHSRRGVLCRRRRFLRYHLVCSADSPTCTMNMSAAFVRVPVHRLQRMRRCCD